MRVFLALLFAFPGLAWADEELIATYGPILEMCYSEAIDHDAKTACIGIASGACMEQEEGGQSTLGMSMCTQSETEVWDRLLNQEYKNAKDWAAAMDEDDSELSPEFANRSKNLLAAQRAWITFRDADCELAYSSWGDGSMRHIAGTACHLNKTATRTIELWALQDGLR